MTTIATMQDFVQPKLQGTISSKRAYMLIEDYTIEWEEKGNLYRRTVFECGKICKVSDMASVPMFAEGIGFDGNGPSDGAAIVHDDDYEKLGRKGSTGFGAGEFTIKVGDVWIDCTEKYDRSRSDARYRKNCIAGGMPKWKARLEFLALRVGALTFKNRMSWYFS